MELLKKAFSWKEINSSHRLMLLIVLVLGVLSFFWGEKVPAGGGLGWDGVTYADMVRNLGSMISGRQLSGYYTQRILPAAIVRGMLLLSGAPIDTGNIIRGFEVYNLILLAGACWAWKRIAGVFDLSLGGRWIGFSGIFVSYECSKQAFYYPVLTDVTALFVAMLLLLFYVEKKPLALFVTTVIGAFCWPVVSFCGAFLLLFLTTELPKDVVAPASSERSRRMSRRVIRGGLVLLALSVIGYIIMALIGPLPDSPCNLPAFVAHAQQHFASYCTQRRVLLGFELLITALPSIAGMLLALAMLVGSRKFVPAVLIGMRRAKPALIALAAAAVLVPFFLVKAASNPAIANEGSLKNLVIGAFLPPEGKFLLPFVTLAVFWGPVLLLMILCWKAFCVEARRLGPGVMAIMGMCMLLGLVGEPRFLTTAWPFLVLVFVQAFEKMRVKASFKYAFTFLTVLFAQFWMKINLAPWPASPFEGIQDYPKQIYFMHYGLWMSWWSYCIQLVALILSAMWLHRTMRNVGDTKYESQGS
jgi:hypothetical protein